MGETKDSDIVIVGCGPAGLLAAIESWLKGYTVVAIDKRDDFIRPNALRVGEDVIAYLNELIGKISPLVSIKTQTAIKALGVLMSPDKGEKAEAIQIKDIENVLFLIAEDLGVEFKLAAEVTSIQTETQQVQIKTKSGGTENFTFNHLIGADGTAHDTSQKVNNNIRLASFRGINYEDVNHHPDKNQKHAAVYYKINKNETTGSDNIKQNVRRNTLDMKNHYDFRVASVSPAENNPDAPNYSKNKHYITGPINEKIPTDSTEQKEVLKNWVDNHTRFSQTTNNEIRERSQSVGSSSFKARLDAQIFTVHIQHANKACMPLGNGGNYILLGDNYCGSYYQLGTGLEKICTQVKAFSESLPEKPGPSTDAKQKNKAPVFNSQNYESKSREIVAELENDLKKNKATSNSSSGSRFNPFNRK